MSLTSTNDVKILVVDDDVKVRLLLRRCFEEEGYSVIEAADKKEVLECLTKTPVSLITLDLNLGNDDGLAVAREIRAQSSVPIIMVTGKGDVIDKVVGLELGADDYISKPFHIREVVARVRSVIRRTETRDAPTFDCAPPKDKIYRFDHCTVDFTKFELHRDDGVPCDLTTSELALLEVFVTHAKRVLSRDQIMDLQRGHEWSPNDRSIDNQIARLRKKIEKDPENPKLIKTVRGVGYSFAADVKAI